MTTQTLEQQQIAALNRVLAEATKECPGKAMHPEGFGIHPDDCDFGCQGTGRVARFPGFRQACGHGPLGSQVWEVRAGGLEDALAGLIAADGWVVLERLGLVLENKDPHPRHPMPSADEILAEGLELVCEVAGLEEKSD